jgi:hypothetical protein
MAVPVEAFDEQSSVACVSRSGWVLSVYPEAGEAGGTFRYAGRPARRGGAGGPAADPERSKAEAARRARGKLRRYCAANRLNRLGTLTYAGVGCHDPRALRRDLASFFRSLRRLLGGGAFPYVWVPEWHKTDHGLHAHFAVGQHIKRGVIERAWGRGFVHIKLLGDLPVGAGRLEEARKAAGYLAKYVGKAIDERRIASHHRYEVAQSFQPRVVPVYGRSADEAIEAASHRWMGGRQPTYVWSSAQQREWKAPPAVWVSWAG